MSEKIQFLPFSAINAFMRDDYRLSVIRLVLSKLSSVSGGQQAHINRLVKKHVQVPGFRNSASAPSALKIKPFAAAFEKDSDLVAHTVAAWSELQPELRAQVHSLLTQRGWELLPPEADRTHLPGFLTRWYAGDTFEVLTEAFHTAYPDSTAPDDDISLMVVWLSGRLPYETDEPGDIPA